MLVVDAENLSGKEEWGTGKGVGGWVVNEGVGLEEVTLLLR